MYHFKITALIAVLFLFSSASCDERKANNEQEVPEQMLDPVETQDPNTTYQPAFDGQTRIAGVKTETPYSVTTLTSDLDSPWAVVELPDGRLAITEKGGTMRIATKEGAVSEAITGFPEVDNNQNRYPRTYCFRIRNCGRSALWQTHVQAYRRQDQPAYRFCRSIRSSYGSESITEGRRRSRPDELPAHACNGT